MSFLFKCSILDTVSIISVGYSQGTGGTIDIGLAHSLIMRWAMVLGASEVEVPGNSTWSGEIEMGVKIELRRISS